MQKVINKINVKNILDNSNINDKDKKLILLALQKNESNILRQRKTDRYNKPIGTYHNNKGYNSVFHGIDGKFTSLKNLLSTLQVS